MNLSIHNLRLALDPFTLEIDLTITGRMTAIFGASGSGKTSLLEVIAGLRRPATAMIRLDDEVLTDTASGHFVPAHRRSIGYVVQESALFPHLSVQGNLLYGRRNGMKEVSPEYRHVVEALEIEPLAQRGINALSGGEKQRVAFARALLASPRLLLLDEPLAGLDAPLKERILPYLEKLRDEFRIPMLYVTHDPADVVALCDEVVVLERGRCIRQGIPREVFACSTRSHYELGPATGKIFR